MCLGHVLDRVSNPWIGGADDEADGSELSTSNALGEREDQLLQTRRRQGDPRQIEDKELYLFGMAELCSYTIPNESGLVRIPEQQNGRGLLV